MVENSIHLLDVRPELGRDLGEAEFTLARSTIVVPAAVVERGPVDGERLAVVAGASGPLLAAVVVDGLLTSELRVDGRQALSLHGPGDLLLLDGVPATLPAGSYTFNAVCRSTLALLDERFLALQVGWPQVAARLLMEAGREVRRGERPQDGRVEERLFDVLSSAAAALGVEGRRPRRGRPPADQRAARARRRRAQRDHRAGPARAAPAGPHRPAGRRLAPAPRSCRGARPGAHVAVPGRAAP